MNRLRLEHDTEVETGSSASVAEQATAPVIVHHYVSLYIDDERIAPCELDRDGHPDRVSDVLALGESLSADGEYMVVTCTCGCAECAMIKEAVRVSHHSGTVKWSVGSAGVLTRFGYDGTAIFDAEQYRAAVEEARAEVARLIAEHEDGPLSVAPYGTAAAFGRPELDE